MTRAWQAVVMWDNGDRLEEIYNDNADSLSGAEVLLLKWFERRPAEPGITHTGYIYEGELTVTGPNEWTFKPLKLDPRVLDRPKHGRQHP